MQSGQQFLLNHQKSKFLGYRKQLKREAVQRAASDLTRWLIWSATEDGKHSSALWVTPANQERPLPFDKVTLSCTGLAGGTRVSEQSHPAQGSLRKRSLRGTEMRIAALQRSGNSFPTRHGEDLSAGRSSRYPVC